VRKKISISRKNREDREAIYSVIETTDFPALVDLYREMCACESIMRILAKRNRWRDFLGFWGFVVGGIGVALAIVSIWLIFNPPRVASSPSIDAKPGVSQQR
jgi:hypothetical protein